MQVSIRQHPPNGAGKSVDTFLIALQMEAKAKLTQPDNIVEAHAADSMLVTA